MPDKEVHLLSLLDATHKWPSIYAFKFVVPVAQAKELQALMPEAQQVESRASSGGKYTAFTFHCPMGSGREVLAVYARVKAIPGLISL